MRASVVLGQLFFCGFGHAGLKVARSAAAIKQKNHFDPEMEGNPTHYVHRVYTIRQRSRLSSRCLGQTAGQQEHVEGRLKSTFTAQNESQRSLEEEEHQ